jgi:DNA-binding NarL/FixJ family response regulator
MAEVSLPPAVSGHRGSVCNVLVVDDHPVFRRGLVDCLEEQADIHVCGQVGTAVAAIASLAQQEPDVALVDLSLGSESGLELIAALAQHHPRVRILVLSGHDELVHADRALKAGALGYVMKDKPLAELMTAVRRVAAGKTYVSPSTADRILSGLNTTRRAPEASCLDRLTDRERRVLSLLGSGRSTREIADELDLSVKTVESHFAHMKEKLGVRSGRELMRVAVRWADYNAV